MYFNNQGGPHRSSGGQGAGMGGMGNMGSGGGPQGNPFDFMGVNSDFFQGF